MTKWVRIRSWHMIRVYWPDQGIGNTFCGRSFDMSISPVRDEFPENEPTCESCFRLRQ